MRKKYHSVYAAHIMEFIELKNALGFKFVAPQSILLKLDRFATLHGQRSEGLTKEFCNKWCRRMPNETERYRYARITIAAQFSKYLCKIKIKSHIPKLPPYPKGDFIPYIYCAKDMEAIFRASSQITLSMRCMPSGIMVVPTLIRVLYATGIRINEALSLKDGDVNVNSCYIKISDSKNGKERVVPITKSLAGVCQQYINYRNKLPISLSGYFFVRLNGKKCSYPAVTSWFKEVLQLARIDCLKRQQPRIHDLRHTFAVTSLANMAAAGIDLYASLPILSTYLGHQSVDSTNYYVRLTANMYPELIKELEITCLDVFPKFKYYETDEFF